MIAPFRSKAGRSASRPFVAACVAALFFAAAIPAQAQQPPAEPPARIIVIGEGSVRVAPDYAAIGCGVTTKAKTAKEATDANSKAMAAVAVALHGAGIEQKDIQTTRFSLQPVYAPPQPNTEPKLTGFSVSNQFRVTIRQIGNAGDILDRLIAAGATDVGSVEFLHSDTAKALDAARTAAMADAKRKGELYAQAAGLTLGGVGWITEDSAYTPPMPFAAMRKSLVMAAVPIASGEDALRVRITVGFDFAR
ncbi:MAG: SIMPL domain-containing protein [Xanthobacteraceae bacterium]